MDRENNTRTHTHDTYILCVYVPTHTCARARGIVSKNGRAVTSPPRWGECIRAGGAGRHSVRRRRSDGAPRMSECVSRRVYTVQAVALPMCRRHCGRRNGTTSRQSPVSRQPSNTSLCVCCSPRRTQLVASCVRYINCYNYYVRCCYYYFIFPFTFSKKCPFLFSRVSLTPLHFSSRQCAPVQLYTTFFMGLVKKMEWLKWIRKYSTGKRRYFYRFYCRQIAWDISDGVWKAPIPPRTERFSRMIQEQCAPTPHSVIEHSHVLRLLLTVLSAVRSLFIIPSSTQ